MNLTLAICLYNKEKYIEATLESVIKQTFQEFELLIVDDCSTDSSVSIVKEFFKRHPRPYELIELNINKGIGYGRYFAERHATTKYMMFLDSDDILYPNAIEKMYNKIISDDDLMAVGCYLEHIDLNGKKIGGGIYIGETTKEDFYKKASQAKLIFMQVSAIYDREIALSVGGFVIDGFPEGRPRYQDFCEDLDLWTRMSDLYKQGKAIVVLPEVLYQYRKAGGLSSSSYNMIIKMRYVKKNLLLRRKGEHEVNFITFLNQLSEADKTEYKRYANAADSLRNGIFYLRNHSFVKGLWLICKSIYYKPSYLYDKIIQNFLKKWKK